MHGLSVSSANDVSAFVTEAAAARGAIVPSGGATKLAWGGRSLASERIFSTRGLVEPLHHFAGDLVAVLPAGLTLSEANAILARHGQWLPLDPCWPERATIGGLVATNDSGPRRYAHGAPRDLIVGIEVVLADGRIARAGGRVVKNVAGYDLSRLFCGSHGSLGVITSATFKLAPLAAASTTIVGRFPTSRQALAAAAALSLAPVTPSAFELRMPVPELLVRFETTSHASREMGRVAMDHLRAHGAIPQALEGGDESRAWDQHLTTVIQQRSAVVKVSVLPTGTEALFASLNGAAVEWAAVGRVALGVMVIGLNGGDNEIASAIERLQTEARVHRGHVQILEASPAVRQRVALPPNSAAALMQAVKRQFDPLALFPPVPGVPAEH
jgi:glycolate oxidase FAD binding subunit